LGRALSVLVLAGCVSTTAPPPAPDDAVLLDQVLTYAAAHVEPDHWEPILSRPADLDSQAGVLPGPTTDLDGKVLTLDPPPDRELCWRTTRGHVCAAHYAEGVAVHRRP
jgi:hypothetical protein